MRLALRFEDIYGKVRRKFYRVTFPADSLAMTYEESTDESFAPIHDTTGVRKAILLGRYWTIIHQLLAQRIMYEHDHQRIDALRRHFESEMKEIGGNDNGALAGELELLSKLPKVAPQPEKCCCTIM